MWIRIKLVWIKRITIWIIFVGIWEWMIFTWRIWQKCIIFVLYTYIVLHRRIITSFAFQRPTLAYICESCGIKLQTWDVCCGLELQMHCVWFLSIDCNFFGVIVCCAAIVTRLHGSVTIVASLEVFIVEVTRLWINFSRSTSAVFLFLCVNVWIVSNCWTDNFGRSTSMLISGNILLWKSFNCFTNAIYLCYYKFLIFFRNRLCVLVRASGKIIYKSHFATCNVF